MIGMRTAVDKLIEAEKKRMPKPRDPSAQFPDMELFKGNELMQQELDRVRRGKPMDKLDLSRYQLELPSSLSSSSSSISATEATAGSETPSASEELPDGRVLWLKALDNANAQLEHQGQRILNLELVQKFGGNAWNIHNYQMEYDLSLLKKALDDKRAEVMELNKQRKRDQVIIIRILIVVHCSYLSFYWRGERKRYMVFIGHSY
jgi:pre-mRNA-splicing factor SPF27